MLVLLGGATAALTSGFTFQQWILQLPLGLLHEYLILFQYLLRQNCSLARAGDNFCGEADGIEVAHTRVT